MYGFIVPDKVTGVDLVCFPENMIVECNAEWDVSNLCAFITMYVYVLTRVLLVLIYTQQDYC